MNNELLPCPFKDCHGTMEYHEDDYNNGYLCPECEGWVMPCLKHLEAHADKAVPDGWQDISTAPKDGTHIIVFRPVYDGQYIPQVGVDYFKKWSAEPNGSWMKSRADCQPTHWMPFPQPPKEGDYP